MICISISSLSLRISSQVRRACVRVVTNMLPRNPSSFRLSISSPNSEHQASTPSCCCASVLGCALEGEDTYLAVLLVTTVENVGCCPQCKSECFVLHDDALFWDVWFDHGLGLYEALASDLGGSGDGKDVPLALEAAPGTTGVRSSLLLHQNLRARHSSLYNPLFGD